MASSQQVHEIISAVESGAIGKATLAELSQYISLLAHSNVPGAMSETQYTQVSEVVRLNMLRAMIDRLQTKITELDAKNARTQVMVAVLAVASLIGTGFQTWYEYKADRRSEAESEATAQQRRGQQPAASAPIRDSLQSNRPASSPVAVTSATPSPTVVRQK